jgi:hypothetical protein
VNLLVQGVVHEDFVAYNCRLQVGDFLRVHRSMCLTIDVAN